MNAEKPITLIIVDDHPLVREGLKLVIERDNRFKVIDESDNAEDTIRKISTMAPDMITIDISLNGETNGLELVKGIKNRYPAIKTIVISMHEEYIYIERAIRAGAMGYLMKKEAIKEIVTALDKINQGELYLNERVSAAMLTKMIKGGVDDAKSPVNILSMRELEVFELIGNGFGAGDIAKKMNISTNTVESYRRKLKDKLDLKNAGELNKAAVQWVLGLKQ
jgi:DNA-binding NarL/FixJ family response regulator